MPDTTNPTPFAQGDAATPAVPSQQETSGLADSWRNWMASPQNRASMIQFGLALSQPIGAGQNVGGQIGQAFGQAGEAADRVTAEQQRAQELASKQDLRVAQGDVAEARATAAGARAGAAESRAGLAQGRLDLAQQVYEMRRTQGDFQARLKAQDLYRKMKAANDLTGEPTPSFEEFWSSLGMGGGAAPGAGAGTGAPVRVNTPAEAQALTPGTPYITPDGKHYTR